VFLTLCASVGSEKVSTLFDARCNHEVLVKTGVYNMPITNEVICFKGLAAYNTKEMNQTASTLNWIGKKSIALYIY